MNLIPFIEWGKKFRGFLSLAAFLLLVFLSGWIYLFKQGSGDHFISGFGKLNADQFFAIVCVVLGLAFILLMLLIILGYRSTRPVPNGDVSGQTDAQLGKSQSVVGNHNITIQGSRNTVHAKGPKDSE